MANDTKPTAATAPKKVRARVVTNYGRHLVGAFVEVDEAEYNRLRKGDAFPVLISKADEDAIEAKKRAADAASRAAVAATDTDRATSQGWAAYQAQAGQILAAKRIEDAKATHALLTGGVVTADPEAIARQFAANVAAGRGA